MYGNFLALSAPYNYQLNSGSGIDLDSRSINVFKRASVISEIKAVSSIFLQIIYLLHVRTNIVRPYGVKRKINLGFRFPPCGMYFVQLVL